MQTLRFAYYRERLQRSWHVAGQAMLFSLEAGDEVAVLPVFGASAAETLEIAPIIRTWRVLITLPGNRIYNRMDGCPVGNQTTGYIVPATDVHREAARRNALLKT